MPALPFKFETNDDHLLGAVEYKALGDLCHYL